MKLFFAVLVWMLAFAIPANAAAPEATVNVTVVAQSTGVHMLDDTGCQDMAANSKFNLSEAGAAVDSGSATMISNASGILGSGGHPGLQVPKQFAVVPTSQPLLSIGSNGRSTHPSSFPIPSYGVQIEASNGDGTMSLVEQTNPPTCSFWEGYDFSQSGSTWTGYSGNGPIPGLGAFLDYPQLDGASGAQPCDGVADVCPIEMGANLSYWEMNHGATNPILHTLHGERPSGVTCDASSNANCIHVTGGSTGNFGIIRLKSSVTCPSDANANAVCVALKTFGETVDDNGCCWNLYTEKELRSLDGRGADLTVPAAVTNFVGTLVISNFDVIHPVWSGVY